MPFIPVRADEKCAVGQPEGAVPEVERLINAISELRSVVDVLADRLAPVLLPSGPDTPPNKDNLIEGSPLTAEITAQRLRVERTIREINDLTHRLHL